MDKIKTVKIKNEDGSVSEETYTISVDAKNVDMVNGKDVQETIGAIDVDKDGSIAEQLKKNKNYDNDIRELHNEINALDTASEELEATVLELATNKMNKTDIVDNLNGTEADKALSAKQGKILNEKFKQYFKVNNTMSKAQIQAIFNIDGYKIIEFEKGDYIFDGYFILNKNTSLYFNGSKLTFTGSVPGFRNFLATDEFLGFNGNGNIVFYNGTIEVGHCSFCHAKNIKFIDMTFTNCSTGHILEMAAIDTLEVDGCTFSGVVNQEAARNYVEYIQTDQMTRVAFPWFDSEENVSYDKTMSKNWIIKNCKFLKPNNDTHNFYSAIGTHSSEDGYYYENIVISNNLFDDYYRYGIRLYNYKNVIIEDNIFKKIDASRTQSENVCICFDGQYLENVTIRNNEFNSRRKAIKFSSEEAKDVIIENNTMHGFYITENDAVNSAILSFAYTIENLIIRNNIIYDFERKLMVLDGQDATKESLIFDSNRIYTDKTVSHYILDLRIGKHINIINNYIYATIEGAYNLIDLGSNIEHCEMSFNNFISNIRTAVSTNSYTGSFTGIKDVSILGASTNAATLTNKELSYDFTEFDTMRLILGSTANPIIISVESYRPMEKLAISTTYQVPFVYNSNVEILTLSLNQDKTITASTTNSSVKILGIRLSNKERQTILPTE